MNEPYDYDENQNQNVESALRHYNVPTQYKASQRNNVPCGLDNTTHTIKYTVIEVSRTHGSRHKCIKPWAAAVRTDGAIACEHDGHHHIKRPALFQRD